MGRNSPCKAIHINAGTSLKRISCSMWWKEVLGNPQEAKEEEQKKIYLCFISTQVREEIKVAPCILLTREKAGGY